MSKLLLSKLIFNGGPGSGNHNPGQGRGIGKPGNSLSINYSSDAKKFFQRKDTQLIKDALKLEFSKLNDYGIKNDIEVHVRRIMGKEGVLAKASLLKNGRTRVTLDERLPESNTEKIGSIKQFDENKWNLGEKQSHSVDNTFRGIIRHELGHVKEMQMMTKSGNMMSQETMSSIILAYAFNGKPSSSQRNFSFQRKNLKISEYGKTNMQEAIAESFCNPNFSEQTQQINKALYYVSDLVDKKEIQSIDRMDFKDYLDLMENKKSMNQYSDIENIELCIGYPESQKSLNQFIEYQNLV